MILGSGRGHHDPCACSRSVSHKLLPGLHIVSYLGQKVFYPGAAVLIAIFANFGEKIGVFLYISKTNVMIKILQKVAVV
jgi:hypothetical protein